MPLSYYPPAGEVVLCRYPQDVISPEIGKTRPVVVVGPRLRRRGGLATIVPLSTTGPNPVEPYHVLIRLPQPLPAPFDSPDMWAKCDLLSSVALDRLDRFKVKGSRHGGPRRFTTGRVSAEQLVALRAAVIQGLGF